MMKKLSFYKLALFLIFVALVAAGFVLMPRMGLESTNKYVTQVIRHKDCYDLIKASGKMTEDVEEYYYIENDILKKARRAGFGALVVYDATLENLARTGAVELHLEPNKAIAKETHESIFDEVIQGAVRRYGDNVKVTGESPNRVLEFTGSTKAVDLHNPKLARAVQQLPLGIMSHELKRFRGLGLDLIVAPENFPGMTKEDVDEFFAKIGKYKGFILGLMPANTSIYGYPYLLDYVAQKLDRHAVVLQEHYTQLGFFPVGGQIDLASKCNYNVLRAYIIDRQEMNKLTFEEALRRWAVADAERNIRVNIALPFLQGADNLIDANIEYLENITRKVQSKGFVIGLASPFDFYNPPRFLLIPVIMGIVAAGILLGQLLLNWSFNTAVVLWGFITGFALFGNFAYVVVTHQALALMAAISFPILSLYRIGDMLDDLQDVSLPKIIANGIITLGMCVIFSLCGACLLAAILTDGRFLLEIDYYRGVKLTFVVPLVLIMILYLKKYDVLGFRDCHSLGEYCDQLIVIFKKCIEPAMLMKILIVLVLGGSIFYIFIARTGHSWAVPIPDWELQMRYFLEEHLYARPREKEFLIGHVAFFLVILGMHKRWNHFSMLLLTIGALIGQVSLVETFCHLRTPFLMSLARAGIGYVFGSVLGIAVLIFAYYFWHAGDDEL